MISRQCIQNILKRNLKFQKSLPFSRSSTPIYGFALSRSTLDSKDKLQLIRKQSWFNQYETATKSYSENKFNDALKSYYKIIQSMEQKNQKGQAYYYKTFQKILKINIMLNRPLQAQQNFYKLIKTKKTLQKNPIFVYEDYQNLMIHLLKHDVEKAIKLGKALLSESQINNLPINNQKHIRMLLGNGYLLIDNIPDAKKKYSEVIEMKPNHFLKGKILNNLALACWWHKNPLFPSFTQAKDLSYDEVRINRDFKQTKQLLMNSIGSLENIEELAQKQGNQLQNLLNQNPQSMLNLSSKANGSTYSFERKQVLKPLYNIVQYYIYNDPIQKSLILAWMRILLKVGAKFNASSLIDEITSKYYLLNNDINGLSTTTKAIIEKCEKQRLTAKKQQLNEQDLNLRLLQAYKMMGVVNRIQKKQSNKELIDENTRKIESFEKQVLKKDKFALKRLYISQQEISFMKQQNNKTL